jgi:hypothetical protein
MINQLQGIRFPTLEELDQLRMMGKLQLEARVLNDDELKQAKAKRSARFDVGAKSEERGKGWLERHFDAEVKKCALRSIWTPAGEQWVSSDVDYIMSRSLGDGTFRITKIEVKGTITDSFPLSRVSERERRFLNESRRKGFDTWMLMVWWNKTDKRPDCNQMHLMTWDAFEQIERDLKSAASGNFKGNSIRRKIDLKGWSKYEINKVNGRWELSADHWLR